MKLGKDPSELLAFCRYAVPVLNLAGSWIECAGSAAEKGTKATGSGLMPTAIHSTVTEADLLGQETILHYLLSRYPDIVPFAEEDTYHNSRAGAGAHPRYLALDPVDGTLAYTRGEPDYCSMLAVFDDAQFLLGIIHFPALADTYLGAAGAGLYSVVYGPGGTGNPWQLENFQLQPLCAEPSGEEKTLAVHYRFLLKPFDVLARRLEERGFLFKTLKGAPSLAVEDAAFLGSNGALLVDLLRGGSTAFIGPRIALHDVAALAAMMKCIGKVRFYDAAGEEAARWTPLPEHVVIDGIVREKSLRCRVIMALEEQTIEEIEEALWG